MTSASPDATHMRFSVVMSTFNGARWLPAQLQSIAAQSVRPHELVVRDDGSSDGTLGVLTDFAASAPFPVRIDHGQNLGFTRSFEHVIAAATGDVIVLCDQDDTWVHEKLMAIQTGLNDNPRAGWFFSDGRLVDSDDKDLAATLWQRAEVHETFLRSAARGDALPLLRIRPYVTGAAMAFKASYRAVLLPFPDLVHQAHLEPPWVIHDGWIALVMSALSPAAVERHALINYRIHDGQAVSFKQRPGPLPKVPRRRLMEIEARNLSPLVERLQGSTGSLPHTNELVEDLAQRLAHLNNRLSLCGRRRIGRLPLVISEARAGRYRRYSRRRSAVLDLLRGQGR